MARPELGAKRQCMNCGAKFYDLSKDPIVCPKCATVFQAAAPTRVAAPAVARQRPQEEEPEVEPAGPEMVSLDEVAADEAEKDPVIADDIEVAEDVGTDDTFLETDEEEGDDVSGLIEGELEDDDDA